MKPITLWLTLGLLTINPLKPASAEDSHTESDDDDDDDESYVPEKKATRLIKKKFTHHIETVHLVKKSPVKRNDNQRVRCGECNKMLNRKSMSCHMRALHRQENPQVKKESVPIPIAAPISNKQSTIDTFNALPNDQKYTLIRPQLYSCNLCHKKNTKPSDMKEHFKVHSRMTTDNMLKPFICKYCQFYFFISSQSKHDHENNFCLDPDSPHMIPINGPNNDEE